MRITRDSFMEFTLNILFAYKLPTVPLWIINRSELHINHIKIKLLIKLFYHTSLALIMNGLSIFLVIYCFNNQQLIWKNYELFCDTAESFWIRHLSFFKTWKYENSKYPKASSLLLFYFCNPFEIQSLSPNTFISFSCLVQPR